MTMHAPPVSEDDLIEGQKIAEALAERFPHEMNSHKGRLFALCKIMVAALARDMRAKAVPIGDKCPHGYPPTMRCRRCGE